MAGCSDYDDGYLALIMTEVEYFYKIKPLEEFHSPEVRAHSLEVRIFRRTIKRRRILWNKVREVQVSRDTMYRDIANNETIPNFIIRAHSQAKKRIRGLIDPVQDELERDYQELKNELKAESYSFVESLVGDDDD